MSEVKKKPQDNSADQQNANKGTSGENAAHKAGRDNRANQKNPNNTKTK
ncbi:MAG: hypothetical protein II956_03035 [Bacteroidales bacterium]|nr:hypothetical protein [Bacteroidales bacterium]